jgi:formylglycine-generating enzyme required for sulfatase activity
MAERQRDLNRRYGGLDTDFEDSGISDLRFEILDLKSRMPDMEARRPESESQTGKSESRNWKSEIKTLDLGDGVTLELVKIPESPGGKSFWIGRTEVSNRQFARFDPLHDSRIETDDFMQFGEEERGDPVNRPEQPVCRVSWQQAKAFCAWLSARCGVACALPSGEQWEWAARAGAAGNLAYGTCETDFSTCANLADAAFRRVKTFPPWDLPRGAIPPWRLAVTNVNDGFRVSAPVGSFAPNAWGVCDVHGNVAEWTLDAAEDGVRRLARGGSWWSRPERAAFGEAWPYVPWQGVFDVGFRVVVAEDAVTAISRLSGAGGIQIS